jgi:hypothetical protein
MSLGHQVEEISMAPCLGSGHTIDNQLLNSRSSAASVSVHNALTELTACRRSLLGHPSYNNNTMSFDAFDLTNWYI